MNPSVSLKIAVIFCALLVPVLWANSHASETRINFEHVIATGAEIRGNAVIQDQQGFIWMATQNGLARYDGYGLKWYKKGVEEGSISYNQANALLEGGDGMIWIGTLVMGLTATIPGPIPLPDMDPSRAIHRVWVMIRSGPWLRAGTVISG